jgi:hypothetical protein
MHNWLVSSRPWSTPLHHVSVIDVERARWLLRDGADIYAAESPGAPTPLSLARLEPPLSGGLPPDGSAAQLVLQASLPWSPQTHELFPATARAQAVMLLRMGYLLFVKESRFDEVGSARGLYDCWVACVIPHAVLREEWDWLATNCRVRIHGIKARPALNNTFARVVSFDAAKDRYGVKVEHAGKVSIKRSNLARLS